MLQGIHPATLVYVCDTQPVAVEGIKALVDPLPDLDFAESAGSLDAVPVLGRRGVAGVLLLDKAFGHHALVSALEALRASHSPLATVIWGAFATDAEALRYLQARASGILRKTASLPTAIDCLRTVASGKSWMEWCNLRVMAIDRWPDSDLTPREQQVKELAEQGFKNREIASELGIRPGTVKIHLKHIFEKTGVRGRCGLALYSLRERVLTSTAG